MTIDDQVAILFARANPVPSLDLLDPMDIDALTDQSERSSKMTEVQTIEPKKEGRRPLPRMAIGAAIALVAVVIVGLVVNTQSEVASPASVAEAYLDANNAQDIDAVTELLAPDTTVSTAVLPARWEYERATGWVFPTIGCEERSSDANGTLVTCRYQIDGSWMRALDLEPAVGMDLLLIRDGRVQSVTEEPVVTGGSNVGEAWSSFYDWIVENHSGDTGTMYLAGSPLYTPEAIPLWEQYTEEFVAEHQG